ncbi:hypothetical protein HDU97_002712 [Phlyctochytrium planicorne]|nr:hypothetical protein HDU97_002712 [Phlyctochytrium planicorne]
MKIQITSLFKPKFPTGPTLTDDEYERYRHHLAPPPIKHSASSSSLSSITSKNIRPTSSPVLSPDVSARSRSSSPRRTPSMKRQRQSSAEPAGFNQPIVGRRREIADEGPRIREGFPDWRLDLEEGSSSFDTSNLTLSGNRGSVAVRDGRTRSLIMEAELGVGWQSLEQPTTRPHRASLMDLENVAKRDPIEKVMEAEKKRRSMIAQNSNDQQRAVSPSRPRELARRSSPSSSPTPRPSSVPSTLKHDAILDEFIADLQKSASSSPQQSPEPAPWKISPPTPPKSELTKMRPVQEEQRFSRSQSSSSPIMSLRSATPPTPPPKSDPMAPAPPPPFPPPPDAIVLPLGSAFSEPTKVRTPGKSKEAVSTRNSYPKTTPPRQDTEDGFPSNSPGRSSSSFFVSSPPTSKASATIPNPLKAHIQTHFAGAVLTRSSSSESLSLLMPNEANKKSSTSPSISPVNAAVTGTPSLPSVSSSQPNFFRLRNGSNGGQSPSSDGRRRPGSPPPPIEVPAWVRRSEEMLEEAREEIMPGRPSSPTWMQRLRGAGTLDTEDAQSATWKRRSQLGRSPSPTWGRKKKNSEVTNEEAPRSSSPTRIKLGGRSRSPSPSPLATAFWGFGKKKATNSPEQEPAMSPFSELDYRGEDPATAIATVSPASKPASVASPRPPPSPLSLPAKVMNEVESDDEGPLMMDRPIFSKSGRKVEGKRSSRAGTASIGESRLPTPPNEKDEETEVERSSLPALPALDVENEEGGENGQKKAGPPSPSNSVTASLSSSSSGDETLVARKSHIGQLPKKGMDRNSVVSIEPPRLIVPEMSSDILEDFATPRARKSPSPTPAKDLVPVPSPQEPPSVAENLSYLEVTSKSLVAETTPLPNPDSEQDDKKQQDGNGTLNNFISFLSRNQEQRASSPPPLSRTSRSKSPVERLHNLIRPPSPIPPASVVQPSPASPPSIPEKDVVVIPEEDLDPWNPLPAEVTSAAKVESEEVVKSGWRLPKKSFERPVPVVQPPRLFARWMWDEVDVGLPVVDEEWEDFQGIFGGQKAPKKSFVSLASTSVMRFYDEEYGLNRFRFEVELSLFHLSARKIVDPIRANSLHERVLIDQYARRLVKVNPYLMNPTSAGAAAAASKQRAKYVAYREKYDDELDALRQKWEGLKRMKMSRDALAFEAGQAVEDMAAKDDKPLRVDVEEVTLVRGRTREKKRPPSLAKRRRGGGSAGTSVKSVKSPKSPKSPRSPKSPKSLPSPPAFTSEELENEYAKLRSPTESNWLPAIPTTQSLAVSLSSAVLFENRDALSLELQPALTRLDLEFLDAPMSPPMASSSSSSDLLSPSSILSPTASSQPFSSNTASHSTPPNLPMLPTTDGSLMERNVSSSSLSSLSSSTAHTLSTALESPVTASAPAKTGKAASKPPPITTTARQVEFGVETKSSPRGNSSNSAVDVGTSRIRAKSDTVVSWFGEPLIVTRHAAEEPGEVDQARQRSVSETAVQSESTKADMTSPLGEHEAAPMQTQPSPSSAPARKPMGSFSSMLSLPKNVEGSISPPLPPFPERPLPLVPPVPASDADGVKAKKEAVANTKKSFFSAFKRHSGVPATPVDSAKTLITTTPSPKKKGFLSMLRTEESPASPGKSRKDVVAETARPVSSGRESPMSPDSGTSKRREHKKVEDSTTARHSKRPDTPTDGATWPKAQKVRRETLSSQYLIPRLLADLNEHEQETVFDPFPEDDVVAPRSEAPTPPPRSDSALGMLPKDLIMKHHVPRLRGYASQPDLAMQSQGVAPSSSLGRTAATVRRDRQQSIVPPPRGESARLRTRYSVPSLNQHSGGSPRISPSSSPTPSVVSSHPIVLPPPTPIFGTELPPWLSALDSIQSGSEQGSDLGFVGRPRSPSNHFYDDSFPPPSPSLASESGSGFLNIVPPARSHSLFANADSDTIAVFVTFDLLQRRWRHFGPYAEWIYLVSMLTAALLGGWIFLRIHQIGCVAVGLLLGLIWANVLLFTGIGGNLDDNSHMVILLVMSASGGAAVFFMEHLVVILGTANVGAIAIVSGVDMLAKTGFVEVYQRTLTGPTPPKAAQVPGSAWGLLAAAIVLAVAGWFVQTRPGPPPQPSEWNPAYWLFGAARPPPLPPTWFKMPPNVAADPAPPPPPPPKPWSSYLNPFGWRF